MLQRRARILFPMASGEELSEEGAQAWSWGFWEILALLKDQLPLYS